MKNKTIEELVMDYLNLDKNSGARIALRQQLDSMGYKLSHLDELDELDQNLENLDVPDPSAAMTENFYEMLSIYKQKQKTTLDIGAAIQSILNKVETRIFLRFAYTVVLLITGWFVGSRLVPQTDYETQLTSMAGQIQEMKELMTINLLNQTSTADRLKGLQSAKELDKIDLHVANALFNTLNNDPNPSVRLVTLQTLSKFTNDPLVRSGLVQSIEFQKSPMVILTLADMMISLQEKTAVDQFKLLLNTPDLNPQVKDKIEKSILVLI